MIKNKQDLKFYMLCDKIALNIPQNRHVPRPVFDVIWKYEILLRKAEYHYNKLGLMHKIFYIFYRLRYQNLGNRLSIYIFPNNFGPGLSIAHACGIVVNASARIGENCRIHEGVTIGATNGIKEAAVIGDNCFLGSGSKIIGAITIPNGVAVGAGAVVVKSIEREGVTVAGVPARIVSEHDSSNNIVCATKIAKELRYYGKK